MTITADILKRLEQYREVYKEYTGHSDSEMPSDEALMEIAIGDAVFYMKRDIRERKRRA